MGVEQESSDGTGEGECNLLAAPDAERAPAAIAEWVAEYEAHDDEAQT